MMDKRWCEWRGSAADGDEGSPEQWALLDEDVGQVG